ncbi:MAG: dihydrolipoyl dehydrogenase, partial [Thaumarchaeota archaeon]
VVLGVQIVGPEASNLISEAVLAIEMGATVEDIALTIHPHPTLSEGLMEAAEAAEGKPIHQLKV